MATYLVVVTRYGATGPRTLDNSRDDYTAFRDEDWDGNALAYARAHYAAEVLTPTTAIATLAQVVESTDYDKAAT